MNKRMCKVALAEMAAVCPRNVSGAIDRLAFSVDSSSQMPANMIVGAIRKLREAGVPVDNFVAAYAAEDEG